LESIPVQLQLPWSQVIESQLLLDGLVVAPLPPLSPPLLLLQAPSTATTATSANIFQIADLMAFSLQFV
jgi:hypothetical protein